MLRMETATKSHQTQNTLRGREKTQIFLTSDEVVLCFKGLGQHGARKFSIYSELRILCLCDGTVKVYALLPTCRRLCLTHLAKVTV
jgi:hypothetical protein